MGLIENIVPMFLYAIFAIGIGFSIGKYFCKEKKHALFYLFIVVNALLRAYYLFTYLSSGDVGAVLLLLIDIISFVFLVFLIYRWSILAWIPAGIMMIYSIILGIMVVNSTIESTTSYEQTKFLMDMARGIFVIALLMGAKTKFLEGNLFGTRYPSNEPKQAITP